MADIKLSDIKDYFDYPSLQAFSKDWKALDPASREQIKGGISNGTFTY